MNLLKILDADIDYIKALGVEIKTNSPLDLNQGLNDLLKEGYGAALIAIIYGLVSVLSDSSKEFDKAAAKQEAFNDAVKEANKNTLEQKTQLRT